MLAGSQPAGTRAAAGPGPSQPCWAPANASVSERLGEKPAQCSKREKEEEKRAAFAEPCQHNPACLPPQSKQNPNRIPPAEEGKAICHLEFFMRLLKIQNPQYCHPRMHGLSLGWVCCCGTPEECFAVVEVTVAILGRECLHFPVDIHDYL